MLDALRVEEGRLTLINEGQQTAFLDFVSATKHIDQSKNKVALISESLVTDKLGNTSWIVSELSTALEPESGEIYTWTLYKLGSRERDLAKVVGEADDSTMLNHISFRRCV